MIRPIIIDSSFDDLNCYSFLNSLHEYGGSCNVVNDFSIKICVPGERKKINVQLFNMITKINEVKTLVNHQHVIQIKIGKLINDIVSVKSIACEKNHYRWNPSTCTCGNSRYFKRNVDI